MKCTLLYMLKITVYNRCVRVTFEGEGGGRIKESSISKHQQFKKLKIIIIKVIRTEYANIDPSWLKVLQLMG